MQLDSSIIHLEQYLLLGGFNHTMTISCPSSFQGAAVAQRVQAARHAIAQRLAELKKQPMETLFLVSLARVWCSDG